MPDSANVLLVAHKTAAADALRDAVRERAARGPAQFHLVVPRKASGLHRVVDPEDSGGDESQEVLDTALPILSSAAGRDVSGSIGDAEPLSAIQDAVNLGQYDEIIISTLPAKLSRWLHVDLVSKARGLGLPVTHVEGEEAATPAAPSTPA